MATIVTRAGKGSPLTHDEVDDNFTNLNTDKVETSAIGTAAAANTGDFATAAQGALADSAVQPNSSPTLTGLTVDGTDTEVLITEDSEGSATLRFADTQADPSQSYAIAYDTSANKANFKINNTQRANFNASGDYMVGPATTDNPFVIYNANNDATKAGVGLRQTGYISAARMNDHAMMLNRMGTDGLTMGIRNDGTFVGGLGNIGGELTFHDSTDSEAMRIDSSGSVGIGTTNPATALDVNGTVTADAATLSGRLTLPTNTYHYSSDGKPRLYYYDNGDTLFRTADDFQFRNNANATIAQIQDTGAISTISTVTATSFIGDGSALTGVGGSTTAGAVGTYVWATSAASTTQAPQFIFGNTFAGTGLFPAGLASLAAANDTNSMKYSSGNAIGVMDTGVSALSGTWRCMAQTPPLTSNLDEQPMALFVRIS